MSTTMMMIDTKQQNNVELLAFQCVECIQDFISFLRSIPEFDITVQQRNTIRFLKVQQQQHNQSQHQKPTADDFSIGTTVPIYSKIKDETLLYSRINETYARATTLGSEVLHQQQHPEAANENYDTAIGSSSRTSSYVSFWTLPNRSQHGEMSPSSSVSTDGVVLHSLEHSQLLLDIVLPLVATLGQCYEILDHLPTPSIPPQQQQQQLPNNNSNDDRNNRKKRPNKPIPPIGMLSLQNYTDIACVIEFLCCNYIVPSLPPNVLLPIKDRVKYHLPKALAGRIPMLSLLWSSTSTSSFHQNHVSSSTSSMMQPTVLGELETIVCILGRLLLLDRFRPMLLPRHITDIMAVIMYRQELCCQRNQIDDTDTPYQLIVNHWIGRTAANTSPSLSMMMVQRNDRTMAVDSYWRVKAYQRLLRHGRTTPLWLRKTVAQHLNQVSTYDLAVLITVFVHEAVDQDYTSAALRLAQALISKDMISSTNNDCQDDVYFGALCEQLVEVIDSWSWNGNNSSINAVNVASMETVWAVLNLLPQRIIDGYWFYCLVLKDVTIRQQSRHNKNDDDVYESDIHTVIRRFTTLFAIHLNNTACVCKICMLLFKQLNLPEIMSFSSSNSDEPAAATELTLLGMIVRLAASPGVMKSTAKDGAILLLNLVVSNMMNVQFDVTTSPNQTVPGIDVLVIALALSLAPCSLDSELLTFEVNGDEECQDFRVLPAVQLRKLHLIDNAIMDFFVKGVEDRVRLIIRVFLTNSTKDDDGIESNTAMSFLFRTLFAAYFCPKQIDDVMDKELPTFFYFTMFLIVPMVGLPLICEGCSPEVLLSLDNDTSIFDIMATIINSAMTHCLVLDQKRNETTEEAQIYHPSIKHLTRRLCQAENIAFPNTRQQMFLTTAADAFDGPDNEMIVSMTSVILGLLVSMLELGAKSRSVEQEEILQSFVPNLLVLADSKSPISGITSDLISAHAQIAEMSSLAAALISSRNVARFDESKESYDRRESKVDFFQEAESDVSSDLPPIRARAMVLLRNRAIAISEQGKDGFSSISKSQDNEELARILLVCMKALNDKESYVYLAAIHTIVAVAESDPTKFVPMIGMTLVSGFFDSHNGQTYELNFEQRTKLTESLTFIVRRRNIFYPILPRLIDLLILGLRRADITSNVNDAKLIHDATHRYFVTGMYDDANADDSDQIEPSLTDHWKEVDLRVRTGGPLFDMENVDVVRSGMMMVVSDLVSVLPPSITARYATILIACCIDTLRFESARPVCRAGATMARELYGALVREQDELLEAVANTKAFDVALSVAMTEGREEILFCTLQRIVSNVDHSVGDDGIERFNVDPALIARCQEAMVLRQNADDGGILLAGTVALEAKRYDDSHPISHLLNRNKTTMPTLTIQEL